MRRLRTVTVTIDMDPDADLEPIRGVDLGSYARLSAEMLRSGLTRPDAIERFAVEHGIAPGDWDLVQAGWIARLSVSEDLRDLYRDATATQAPPTEEGSGDT